MIRINISKKLNLAGGSTNLLIDAEIPDQQITALYGESGAGKTTLLKMLAGLIKPDEGYIEVNGQVWFNSEKRINLPPQKRNIGFVFQDYALFPNMTVKENMIFAAGKSPDHQQIEHLLKIVQLSGFQDHKPSALSGGQQQRAALVRALMRKPQLLLLDEPLSAVDHETRLLIQQELLQLHQEYRFTGLLVSHDKDEIFSLAKNVICIDTGTISQSGHPVDVFAIKNDDNKLIFTGVIISLNSGLAEVLINNQLITVPANNNWKPGDKIQLTYPGNSLLP
ncbi:sulfate/molybdate ABC transporter ATP-binding protein [Mucilaginibacter sp. KACC 22063]|uniref:sulfate/molybdate ABC transporter ATP-binding protein n=1 Tax=Mucilaginibacter sp. KACC 22063 TaxID=3025666 RepID=UPI002365657F|nr:ATP-binding cassette domain-containing protein [Mucilaginibacter sp. KACC 22063]WDF56923.1 ATP-binding cassette domain-containing protein [Mucilaginibacter sp. KACC 22063]